MATRERQLGDRAEDFVFSLLIKNGYTILSRNYLVFGFGELDIVCCKNRTVYVFEVKCRSKKNVDDFGMTSIFSRSKIHKVRKTADIFCSRRGLSGFSILLYGALVIHNQKEELLTVSFLPLE